MKALNWQDFTKLFHKQLGYAYPDDMLITNAELLAVYKQYNQTGVLTVTPAVTESVTPAEVVSPAPVQESVPVTQVVTTAVTLPDNLPDHSHTRHSIDFGKLHELEDKDLMAIQHIANSIILKRRAKRSHSAGIKLTPEQLAGVFSDVMNKAMTGADVKVRSVLAKHIPEAAVKGIAARELSAEQRKQVLSHLSQHKGVTLMMQYLGKSGTNAELKGTISSCINGLSRILRILAKLEQADALEKRVVQLELAVVQLQAGKVSRAKCDSVTVKARPTVYGADDVAQVMALKEAGKSVRDIAELTGINRGKVHRILKAAA